MQIFQDNHLGTKRRIGLGAAVNQLFDLFLGFFLLGCRCARFSCLRSLWRTLGFLIGGRPSEQTASGAIGCDHRTRLAETSRIVCRGGSKSSFFGAGDVGIGARGTNRVLHRNSLMG